MYMRLKLRKIGNSFGVILPKDVITSEVKDGFIELNVITNVITFPTVAENVITKPVPTPEKTKKELDVITQVKFNFEKCKKHHGTYKGTCGCK